MVRLRCLLVFLFQQFANDLVDDLVSQRSHFILSFWLDGMLH